MSSVRGRVIGLAVAALAIATIAITIPGSTSRAATVTPGIRLVTALHHVDAVRFTGDTEVYLPGSVYVAATHGAFEIDVRRHHGHYLLEQVARNGSTVTDIRRIKPPAPLTHLDQGLPAFFNVYLTDASGKVVASTRAAFCPSGDYDSQRISPNSVDAPTYPQTCGDKLTKQIIWGIDAGWAATNYLDLLAPPDAVPDGSYTMHVAIAAPYADQLHLTAAERRTTVTLTLTTESGGCVDVCVEARRARAAARHPQREAHRHQTTYSSARPAGSHGLPNLVALPAHGLKIRHNGRTGQDYLGFGATIWNAGPGTFDVEGFRHNGKPTMQARQYTYRGSRWVRSTKIGTFEFDTRRGHNHWHLEDVARYDLLDAHGNQVVRSDKQSFCLAPTDPIDLLAPGALWDPNDIGLGSACPDAQSLWLRETLPVGWGDTYVQQKGGQAFNVTNLANGRYLIRITTNPRGRIHETTRHDDTALLAIDLGGTPGARTVTRVGPVAASRA